MVFQVQEKAVQLEMSLIKKEINVWRERRRKKGISDAKGKGIDSNISKLEQAYGAAKSIMVKARQFRKAAMSSGFFKTFDESGLLRVAAMLPATLSLTQEEGVSIEDYQEAHKDSKPQVIFFPLNDLPIDTFASGRTSSTEYLNKYKKWANSLAAELTYGDKDAARKQLTTPSIDNEEAIVPFIQLGHLLSHMMGDWTSHPGHGLIMGTIKLPDPEDGKSITYNISDLPISLPLLYNWYFKHVIDSGRQTYAFRTAMKDIINTIVKPMLNRYCVQRHLPHGEHLPISASLQ